jgi:hypothetical protein
MHSFLKRPDLIWANTFSHLFRVRSAANESIRIPISPGATLIWNYYPLQQAMQSTKMVRCVHCVCSISSIALVFAQKWIDAKVLLTHIH